MKKFLATVATLLLAFGSVALSSNIATADDAVTDTPAVVTETITDETAPPAAEADDSATEAPPVETTEPPAETTDSETTEPETEAEPEAPDTEGDSSPPAESARTFQVQALDMSDWVIGTLLPNSSDSNKADYWEDYGPDQAICYKHEGNGGEHGTVTNDGKTVVLNTFNQDWPGDHWELLVVKAGNWDAVTVHPQAGVEYAAYDFKDVSHWIVCKGIKAASAEIVVNPGTCTAQGTIVGGATVNATFAAAVYSGPGNVNYSITATAIDGAKFPAGAGVNGDGTKKTFTGVRPAQLSTDQCVASAAVKLIDPTCDAPGSVVGINPMNATFGAPQYNGLNYTITATATGSAKFAAGDGVSMDGKTKTFTGQVQAQLPASQCAASADVSVKPATCEASGYVVGINPVNATFAAPTYDNGTYTIVATATGIAKFAAGDGVSQNGKTKTFTGPYQSKLSPADCVASADVKTTPATCAADGTVVGKDAVNATFAAPTYDNGTYTIVATATGVATFPAGEGVSPNGKTKTFTGSYQLKLPSSECVAAASVTTAPATCTADGYVVLGPITNATFGGPNYSNGTYTIVATATGVATFPAGPGVTDNGKTKTLTGPYQLKNIELCAVASAAVDTTPGTCEAAGTVFGIDPVNATIGDPMIVDGNYTIVATATGSAKFAPGIGVNAERTTKTFTGQVPPQNPDLCNVTVPYPPASSDEYCFEGETQDGSITVYFGKAGDKIQYRITGEGVDILIESDDDNTVYLPAGDYTVTAEGVDPYKVTGTSVFPTTINAAVNCVCAVDNVEKVASIVIFDPECAEAGVSVTPPTCAAPAALVLGATLHATFGEPVIENGTYKVVATSDDGYRFYPGAGVSDDGFEKTFEGVLPAQPKACGDLTTLSLPNTGGGIAGGALWLGLAGLVLGAAGVVVASRRAAASTKEAVK